MINSTLASGGKFLVLEFRTMGGKENQRTHKSPFDLIEARNNQVKRKVYK